jgi:tetratricopeptide (TPR) repeat protein
MADYAAHNYDGCVAVSDQALAADPNCSWAYNMKGIAIYFANGNKVADECIGLIDKSIEINPQYGYGYFNKALILKGLRRWDDSVASFNKALEFMPGDTWSYYGIATVYGDTNQVDKALQYLKLAIDADKAPPSVKRRAKEEVTTHFARMKNDPRFLALVNS